VNRAAEPHTEDIPTRPLHNLAHQIRVICLDDITQSDVVQKERDATQLEPMIGDLSDEQLLDL
jgi:hypothetical protein